MLTKLKQNLKILLGATTDKPSTKRRATGKGVGFRDK